MQLVSITLILLNFLAEICAASRLKPEERKALILEINEHAKSMLNLTSDHPATKQFLEKAARAGLYPTASDFAHINVGIDENDDCFVLKREKKAQYGTLEVAKIAKVIYRFYLSTNGHLKSPLNLAIIPKYWSICRKPAKSSISYDYVLQKILVQIPTARLVTDEEFWAVWAKQRMFDLKTRRRLSNIWDVIDPVGSVMMNLRHSTYVKVDKLGKTLNPPRTLSFTQKEALFTLVLSKTIHIGPNCGSPLSYLSLRAMFGATKMSNEKHVLCLDATGGYGRPIDVSTRVRSGRVSANVLQTVTTVIDQLTVEDVYKIKRRQRLPQFGAPTGLIVIGATSATA